MDGIDCYRPALPTTDADGNLGNRLATHGVRDCRSVDARVGRSAWKEGMGGYGMGVVID
jgi:hypothetical protein